MPFLVIGMESEDDSDLQWLKNKCVPVVEDEVLTAEEEGRLDAETPGVWWEIVDKLSEVGS